MGRQHTLNLILATILQSESTLKLNFYWLLIFLYISEFRHSEILRSHCNSINLI